MKTLSGIERLKQMKKPGKKLLPDLDKYIIFAFGVMISYTIAEFIVSSLTGCTHDTLTTCVFSAFGGELLLTALLKKWKISRRDN